MPDMSNKGRASEPLHYTIAEAADMLRLSRWSVYALCDSGELASHYIGRRRYVKAASLQEYVENLPTTPNESAS